MPFVENASSPMGIRMTQGTAMGLRPVMPFVRWRSYIKFWYKTLNINSHRLNSSNLDVDTYEFVKRDIRTELSEEERELMTKNGYSQKYIVPNPQIPFEELKLDTFSEKFNYGLYCFNVNTVFKARFFRNLSRKTNKGRANRALREKEKHVEFMKKNFDNSNQYPACPFAGDIPNKYYEFTEVTEVCKPAEPASA